MAQPDYPLNILLVDDDAANRGMFVLMLREIGIGDRPVVETAKHGGEAVEKVQLGAGSSELPLPFDLIFMDCCMPEMDGYAATGHIRTEEGSNRRVTIIGLTALSLAGDRDQCFATGMDDCLSKPISMEDLKAVILKWLPHILKRRQIDV